jgi:hypothetical protein
MHSQEAANETTTSHEMGLIGRRITAAGMRVSCYRVALEQVPADFFADPDGAWTYESLAEAAGFGETADVAIGALKSSFRGHPDGAAVVTLNAVDRPYVAIVECPIQYVCAEGSARVAESAA